MTKVFLAVPAYDGLVPHAYPGITQASREVNVDVSIQGHSLLAHNFNELFADCVNDGSYTHFAMHHADIEAEPGWLDVLLTDMVKQDADLISVVMPIKDDRGLTSCGVWDPERNLCRRFTMKELADSPPTFRSMGNPLCVNTGLWVARLNGWQERFPGFRVRSWLIKDKEGKIHARCMPEDWDFSLWAHREDMRVFLTNKVTAIHHGKKGYSNQGVWGEWETDELYEEVTR